VTVSTGNVTLTKITVTTANVTTANIGTAVITTANVTTANLTTAAITTANVTTANVTTAVITTGNVTTANITTAAITTAGITTANIATANITSAFVSGNVAFTGTGNRITGDFSNATLTNRVSFQTSTVNSATVITVIPNGTNTTTQLNLECDPASTTGAVSQLINSPTEFRIAAGIRGAGTYAPMTFQTGGSERVRIDISGNICIGTTTAYDPLSVAGSIAPAATPSTSWGIDFASSVTPPNYTTLAAAATYDLAVGSGIVVIHNNGNGDGAVFFTYGGNTIKLGGAASVVSGIGTLNQIGLAYNPGAGKYRINNGYATSQSIFITTIRTRTTS
jgi:hypothetical protein